MNNMEKILKQLSLLLVLAYLHIKAGHSELIVFPHDTEVLVNISTYLNCSTSILSEQIHWYHYRVGENKTIYVYYKGQFNQIYADRYSIAKDSVTGEYNLIIRSVQPGDAGRYECQDDGGLGNFSSAELIVLDSTPICQSSMKPDELVGPNSCDLHIDELHLSCSVSYSGNIPPTLQWKMEGDDAPISKGIATDYSGNRVTMNLTMSCELEIDGALFTCSNTRSHDKQYSCSTDPVKINYKIVAVIVPLVIVIGLILVIAIIAAIVCAKKRRKARRKPDDKQETAQLPMLPKPQQVSSVDNDASENRPKTRRKPVDKQETAQLPMLPKPQQVSSVDNDASENRPKNVTNTEDEVVTKKRFDIRRKVFRGPRTSLPKELAICGLAILDQEMFILRLQNSDIEVYDSRKFRFKRRMKVKRGIVSCWSVDIVSCSVNKCLYVSDRGRLSQPPAIIRIDRTTGNIIKAWETSDGNGGCLSIASDTNVILSINHGTRLHEYTADGKLIRKIELSSGTGIRGARHAVKLPNGLFVVCQGDRSDPVRRVCLLSTKVATRESGWRTDEVEILKEFCPEVPEGESVNSLWRPFYLAVDKEGSILVLDETNNRAVLLSFNLDKPEIIIFRDDAKQMLRRTCFDDLTGQWFVAVDHHVIVCRVKD